MNDLLAAEVHSIVSYSAFPQQETNSRAKCSVVGGKLAGKTPPGNAPSSLAHKWNDSAVKLVFKRGKDEQIDINSGKNGANQMMELSAHYRSAKGSLTFKKWRRHWCGWSLGLRVSFRSFAWEPKGLTNSKNSEAVNASKDNIDIIYIM